MCRLLIQYNVLGPVRRLNHFKIIDYGLADFTEYYPSGHVSVGGPTHAVPKSGPLHLSLGKLQMALPLPISAEQPGISKPFPQVMPGCAPATTAHSPCLLVPVPLGPSLRPAHGACCGVPELSL